MENILRYELSCRGEIHFMASNNDCCIREYDMERFQLLHHFRFNWPVNVSYLMHLLFIIVTCVSINIVCLCIISFKPLIFCEYYNHKSSRCCHENVGLHIVTRCYPVIVKMSH